MDSRAPQEVAASPRAMRVVMEGIGQELHTYSVGNLQIVKHQHPAV